MRIGSSSFCTDTTDIHTWSPRFALNVDISMMIGSEIRNMQLWPEPLLKKFLKTGSVPDVKQQKSFLRNDLDKSGLFPRLEYHEIHFVTERYRNQEQNYPHDI